MELPKKFPEQRLEILKAIGPKPGTKKTREEIFSSIPEKFHRNLTKTISNLVQNEYLKSKKNGVIASYSLSAHSREILLNRARITVIPFESSTSEETPSTLPAKRPYKKKAKSSPSPAPLEINISPTANNVADQITALIDENAQYRRLMLNIHGIITKALQLNKEDKNDGNSTTD